MARRIDPHKKLVAEYVYEQKQLPIHLPVAQYIRQSSETQVKKNKQSTILQDEQLSKRLAVMGFRDLIKIDADQGKSGQMVKGGKLVEKKGLEYLNQLITKSAIGAVAAFSPSRLYRDLTREFYTSFVRMLEVHNIPLITYQRVYWPDSRADMDALIDKFAEAARFIEEEIHGKLLPAKYQAIEESISYGGGSVPLGYIIGETEDRKYYVVYDPHADCIRYIFKRYRELGGNLPKLGRELRDTGFVFPAFSGLTKPPHVSLQFDSTMGGYVIKSRTALLSILTNPAYIGWYCFNGVVISKEAHEPIVPFDDFLYAYNRLSSVTLDGKPNVNKPPVDRRFQTGYQAVLEGVLTYNGVKAYVVDNAYRAREDSNGFGGHPVINVALPLQVIDRAFVPAFLSVLAGLQQKTREESGEPTALDALQSTIAVLQEAKGEEVASLQNALKNVDTAIAGWELDKESCRRTGNTHGLDEANTQLKRLHEARAALVEKAKFAESAVTVLAKTQTLLEQAMDTWDGLPFENKQILVKLCVQSADAIYLSPHILQLTITLLAPLSGAFTGYLFLIRGKKPEYSPQELATIRELYPHADRLDILQALPTRSWAAIVHQAMEMGIERFTRRNSSGIPLEWSVQDVQVLVDVNKKHPFAWVRGHAYWVIEGELKVLAEKALTTRTTEKEASLSSSANG